MDFPCASAVGRKLRKCKGFSPCANGGQCELSPGSPYDVSYEYVCKCQEGYHGADCETRKRIELTHSHSFLQIVSVTPRPLLGRVAPCKLARRPYVRVSCFVFCLRMSLSRTYEINYNLFACTNKHTHSILTKWRLRLRRWFLFRNGFSPTLELALFRRRLDKWLTHDCHPENTRSPSNVRLGKPARKHHSLLNTQCFGEFTPHQLSLSRLRKMVPEEYHLYSAVQAQTSPGIQTYRDTPFPERQTPRENQIAAWVSYRSWTVRTDIEDPRLFTTLSPPN